MLNILSLTLMALSIALSSQNKPKARKLLAGREQRIFEEQRMDEERILNDTQPKWRLLAKKDSWSSYYRKLLLLTSISLAITSSQSSKPNARRLLTELPLQPSSQDQASPSNFNFDHFLWYLALCFSPFNLAKLTNTPDEALAMIQFKREEIDKISGSTFNTSQKKILLDFLNYSISELTTNYEYYSRLTQQQYHKSPFIPQAATYPLPNRLQPSPPPLSPSMSSHSQQEEEEILKQINFEPHRRHEPFSPTFNSDSYDMAKRRMVEPVISEAKHMLQSAYEAVSIFPGKIGKDGISKKDFEEIRDIVDENKQKLSQLFNKEVFLQFSRRHRTHIGLFFKKNLGWIIYVFNEYCHDYGQPNIEIDYKAAFPQSI